MRSASLWSAAIWRVPVTPTLTTSFGRSSRLDISLRMARPTPDAAMISHGQVCRSRVFAIMRRMPHGGGVYRPRNQRRIEVDPQTAPVNDQSLDTTPQTLILSLSNLILSLSNLILSSSNLILSSSKDRQQRCPFRF
jgi:hypothetical protein